jgi:hypothetical protein
MVTCQHCGSKNITRNGGNFNTKAGLKSRKKCLDCGTSFTVLIEAETKVKSDVRSLVITSAINGTGTNRAFLNCLKNYADHNNCDLLIIPTRHKNLGEAYEPDFDENVEPYLIDSTIEYPEYGLRIFGGLKLSASLENPLSGLDPLSKGHTLIVGHPQVQLRTLPRVHDKYPPILTTTGSVSLKPYQNTKPGVKASFNHSYSAIVVEFDELLGDKFVHVRHLNYDEDTNGFFDLNTHYNETDVDVFADAAKALITGDEHAIFADPVVKHVTYTAPNSLVNILGPEIIVRHDVLDSHSISHHHKKDFIKTFKKHSKNMQSLEKELDITISYLNQTTPHFADSFIVQSNHNEHLTRWLNECNPKNEPWNAKIYHKLMYEILDRIDRGINDVDPFQLYAFGKLNDNIHFVKRHDELVVDDIHLASHGDEGNNGARGTRDQFSILPDKTVIGHSHSPGIEKGCYQVGTSSLLRLGYNTGASSWHHCHCIIHQNGKRQLVFITNGKYRK